MDTWMPTCLAEYLFGVPVAGSVADGATRVRQALLPTPGVGICPQCGRLTNRPDLPCLEGGRP